MEKKEMYENYHKKHSMWGSGAIHFKDRLDIIINEIKPRSILDYGCGKGNLVQYLKDKYPDMEVCGYDPAVSEYSKLPERKFDLITCTDVLEHIPEVELIESIEKISSMSDHVFFILHHGLAESVLENGENAHCTIKPPEWYYDVFNNYFSYIKYLPAENVYNTGCITFKLSETAELEYYRLTERAAKQVAYKLMSRNVLLRNLIRVDWERINANNLVLYGFGYNCRNVYEIIKDRCQVRCFVDGKKAGSYDNVPVIKVDDYKPVDGETIVVFPEYDFENIKAAILPKLNNTNLIIKASEFFCTISRAEDGGNN